MQRAFAQAVDANNAEGPLIRFQFQIRYLDSELAPANGEQFVVEFDLPYDVSVRDILDAAVDEAISSQPSGFDLEKQDVIVQTFERG